MKRNNEQNFLTLYRKCFEGPRSVTLEMSPKQANKKNHITLFLKSKYPVQQKNKINVIHKLNENTSQIPTRTVSQSDLWKTT